MGIAMAATALSIQLQLPSRDWWIAGDRQRLLPSQAAPGRQTAYDEIIEVRHSLLLTRRSENHGQEKDRIGLSCHGNHRHEPGFLGGCGEKCCGNCRQGAA